MKIFSVASSQARVYASCARFSMWEISWSAWRRLWEIVAQWQTVVWREQSDWQSLCQCGKHVFAAQLVFFEFFIENAYWNIQLFLLNNYSYIVWLVIWKQRKTNICQLWNIPVKYTQRHPVTVEANRLREMIPLITRLVILRSWS